MGHLSSLLQQTQSLFLQVTRTLAKRVVKGAGMHQIITENQPFILGERHDFVLAADQTVGNYWLRAYCKDIKANVLAVVRYEGAAEELPLEPEDTIASSGTVSRERFLKSRK